MIAVLCDFSVCVAILLSLKAFQLVQSSNLYIVVVRIAWNMVRTQFVLSISNSVLFPVFFCCCFNGAFIKFYRFNQFHLSYGRQKPSRSHMGTPDNTACIVYEEVHAGAAENEWINKNGRAKRHTENGMSYRSLINWTAFTVSIVMLDHIWYCFVGLFIVSHASSNQNNPVRWKKCLFCFYRIHFVDFLFLFHHCCCYCDDIPHLSYFAIPLQLVFSALFHSHKMNQMSFSYL